MQGKYYEDFDVKAKEKEKEKEMKKEKEKKIVLQLLYFIIIFFYLFIHLFICSFLGVFCVHITNNIYIFSYAILFLIIARRTTRSGLQ